MTDDASASASVTRDAMHALCLADAVWAERYDGWRDVGRGGSATVVRTFSRDAGAEIALKIFLGLSKEDRIRFQREVRNAQRLTSPFIVRTYSPFARGSLAWIEMELVEGQDLRHELARRARDGQPFSIAEVATVASAVASALATAHAAGVIHRDVKPANVLLPETGTLAAKLGDFGIAHILGATRLTASGLIAATPQFAAPEVVAGRDAGPAADVYGLALCLYLMLSGNRAPFALSQEAPPAQWLRAHAEESPAPIRQHRDDAPEHLALVVDRGLGKDPADRPSVLEILEQLGTPQPFVPLARVASPPRARSLGRLVGVGLAGAVLGGLAVVAMLRMATLAPGTAPSPRASATMSMPSSSPSSARLATAPTSEAEQAPEIAAPAQAPQGSPRAAATAARRVAATPAPTPAPTPIATSLKAVIGGGLLTLSNASARRVTVVRVAMIDDHGERHRMEVGEALLPKEEVLLALDAFTPAPGPAAAPVEVEIDVRDDMGRETAIVVGPGRLERPAS